MQEDQTFEDRMNTYRATVRATFQGMSDQALAFQDEVVIGGIDREELKRELVRRSGPAARVVRSSWVDRV